MKQQSSQTIFFNIKARNNPQVSAQFQNPMKIDQNFLRNLKFDQIQTDCSLAELTFKNNRIKIEKIEGVNFFISFFNRDTKKVDQQFKCYPRVPQQVKIIYKNKKIEFLLEIQFQQDQKKIINIQNSQENRQTNLDIKIPNFSKFIKKTAQKIEESPQLISRKRLFKDFLIEKQQENFCPICYEELGAELGQLESCSHQYCFECLKEWLNVCSICPLCRTEGRKFKKIVNGEIVKQYGVKKKEQKIDEEPDELDNADSHCYVCNQENNANVLLVCDFCVTKCCHIYCLNPPLEFIPEDEWFCDYCVKEEEIETSNPIAGIFRRRNTRQRNQIYQLENHLQDFLLDLERERQQDLKFNLQKQLNDFLESFSNNQLTEINLNFLNFQNYKKKSKLFKQFFEPLFQAYLMRLFFQIYKTLFFNERLINLLRNFQSQL